MKDLMNRQPVDLAIIVFGPLVIMLGFGAAVHMKLIQFFAVAHMQISLGIRPGEYGEIRPPGLRRGGATVGNLNRV